MLHSGARPELLQIDVLGQAIIDAIEGRNGRFLYGPDLFEKLEKHKCSILDLSHVCRTWEREAHELDDYDCWRYVLEGPNLNGKWMRAIVAHTITPYNSQLEHSWQLQDSGSLKRGENHDLPHL